jgi:CHAT domain-containing protein/Tfp pilus assembly protein PilF
MRFYRVRFLMVMLMAGTIISVLSLPTQRATAQVMTQTSNSRLAEANRLSDEALQLWSTSQFAAALEKWQQALAITREVGDRRGEGTTLSNIGLVYDSLGQYPKALEFYQQALAILREIGDRSGEGTTLNNIGGVYDSLGQYPKALELYQQALAIRREIGDRRGEGTTLNNIGGVYDSLGQYPKALELYQQALAISREIGDRRGEGTTLSNIGGVFDVQKQPEVAIAFLKQSVNVRETIRGDIRSLSREQQQSYTETVADTYRRLAALLIDQRRFSEAQQVLELLKIQELREFTRSAEVAGQSSGIVEFDIEKQILESYQTIANFAKQLYECQQSRCNNLRQLQQLLNARTQEFNQQITVFRSTLQQRLAQDPGFLSSDQLNKTARDIVTSEPGTVLVYPLVLQDRIKILLAIRAGGNRPGAGGVVFRSFEVAVSDRQLWQTVTQFREQLQTPGDLTRLQATASQLYDWLIKPMEAELSGQPDGQSIRHLVFSLDRSTRYIPMAALYNSRRQQYLIQQYAVSTILGADLTDVRDRLSATPQNTTVLGMGLSIPVAGFTELSHVRDEVNAIVQHNQGSDRQGIFPGLEFFDRQFTFQNLQDNLAGHRILHIATHADFESGAPENSFFLSAIGKVDISQIQTLINYGMNDVHLVVLSACKTAVGGPDASGIEVPGISSYFLRSGAKAVIASLWLVNDASTSQLMQYFYNNLAQGMTKSEALRQAQIRLLEGGQSGGGDRSSRATIVPTDSRTGQPIVTGNLRHPYYWSPFIIIGNGL